MEIVTGLILPALDRVGEGYEAGEVFLPQLMASAEAARAACDMWNRKRVGKSLNLI